MKKTPLLLIIGIVGFLLIGAYTGYLYWQKSTVDRELLRVEQDLSDYKEEMLQIQNKKVLEAINAREAYEQLSGETIEWSKIIKKIRETLPKERGVSIVDVLSYSGSSTSEISLNIKTDADRDEPYYDVADLIESFDDSEFFVEPFVPSISSGEDEQGKEILTFLLSAQFVEKTLGENGDQSEDESEKDIVDKEPVQPVEEEVNEETSELESSEEAPILR